MLAVSTEKDFQSCYVHFWSNFDLLLVNFWSFVGFFFSKHISWQPLRINIDTQFWPPSGLIVNEKCWWLTSSIGYFIDSCLTCEYCMNDDETNCLKMKTTTAGGKIQFGRVKTNSKYSFGGWSKKMTANRRFVSKIPKGFPLEKAGPCFCAGITMFAPLKEQTINISNKYLI